MVVDAVKLSILYWIIILLDTYILSWQCLMRPIVVAPLAGLLLGDFKTGVIMGAALESVFMGISAIGGSVPADVTTGSIIAVAFTVLTGADMETGLALSLPIGTAMASINGLFTPVWGALSPYWEKLAGSGNIKKYEIQVMLVNLLTPIVSAVVLFFAVAYGVESLQGFLASLPAWVMTGLGAASGMMLAVGFAILTSMIWSKEIGYFFFLGYVMVVYMGLGTLPIAIVGIVIAITMFMSEKRVIDLKNQVSASNQQQTDEEDFF